MCYEIVIKLHYSDIGSCAIQSIFRHWNHHGVTTATTKLSVRLSALRLFHVGHAYAIGAEVSFYLIDWHKWFWWKRQRTKDLLVQARVAVWVSNMKISCRLLPDTSKTCTKGHLRRSSRRLHTDVSFRPQVQWHFPVTRWAILPISLSQIFIGYDLQHFNSI